MPQDSVPWAVGGGAQLQPEVLRALAYAATGGGQGVGGRPDCKVLPLAVPGNKVRVSPGVVTMRNTFPGVAPGQSYLAQWLSEQEVTVPATGGSARSDLLVARVSDPQYDGSTPADIEDGPYKFASLISNVGNTVVGTDGANLPYPAEALARIDIPPSTATITSGMIVDLRRLVKPRVERMLIDILLETGTPRMEHTWPPNVEFYWPSNAITFQVPSWANKMVAVYTIAGVAVSQNMYGASRYVLQDVGPEPDVYYPGDLRRWDFNGSLYYDWDWANENIIMTGSIDVSAIAGKTVLLYVGSRLYDGTGYMDVRSGGRAIFDAQFQETI